jgi:mRNA interferase MazF
MALKYPVVPKTILLCDYNMGGFRAPEMVKRRPVVVLVGRLPRRDYLHTVVPLSGSESGANHHCRIELDEPLPGKFAQTVWWVKADMVSTVCFERLDLFRTERDHEGKRKYLNQLKVSDENFELIKERVRIALTLA